MIYRKTEKWTKEECDHLLHIYNTSPRGIVQQELVKNFPNRTRFSVICKIKQLRLKDKTINDNSTAIVQPSTEQFTNVPSKGFKKMEIRQDHIRLYF